MNELKNIFDQYDNSRSAAPSFVAAKYGMSWTFEQGCIFYPEGYLAKSRSELLARIDPSIPTLIAHSSSQPGNGTSLALDQAASQLPNALLVLCGDAEWAARHIPLLQPTIPTHMLSRCITHRQLGDFLPYGDKSTRWWDVIRKSALPAFPKVRKKVFQAYDLFQDALSQATYLAIMRRYLLSSDAIIPYLDPEEQYFSPVYKPLTHEVFVDCGGFIGDTLQQYLKLDRNFREYIVFEPDNDNFCALTTYIDSLLPEIRSKITPYKLGVSKEHEVYKFSSGEGSNSYIGDDGDIEINCIAMDELIFDKKPTFIKMDLQGHEAFALYGAQNIIKTHMPVLAISVYHFVHDLWDLPLLMKHFYPDYKFYLRAYKHEEEYICYAVPNTRIYNHQ